MLCAQGARELEGYWENVERARLARMEAMRIASGEKGEGGGTARASLEGVAPERATQEDGVLMETPEDGVLMSTQLTAGCTQAEIPDGAEASECVNEQGLEEDGRSGSAAEAGDAGSSEGEEEEEEMLVGQDGAEEKARGSRKRKREEHAGTSPCLHGVILGVLFELQVKVRSSSQGSWSR